MPLSTLLVECDGSANTIYRFPPMFENVGIAKSSGITTAMIVVGSVIPTILIQWQGKKWRAKNK